MLESLFPRTFSPSVLAIVIGGIFIACIFKFLFTSIYNLFFHPLRHIPGPRFAAASKLPYVRHLLNGTYALYTNELHQRYGEVVRVAPNELSFITGESAWQDIYGLQPGKGKAGSFTKDLTWFAPSPNGVRGILSADNENHTRMRKALSPAFSDRAIKQQEAIIQKYMNLLIQVLAERIDSSPDGVSISDVVPYYEWLILDIIVDLTYGKSLNCLATRETTWFMESTILLPKATNLNIVLRHMPLIKPLIPIIIPSNQKRLLARRTEYMAEVAQLTTERLDSAVDRPDFVGQMDGVQGEKGMTMAEIHANLVLIMIAGSETTATMLAGVTYSLCQNREVLKKLQKEVRSVFQTSEEIDMQRASELTYLEAVISEALRIYPPVPTGFPRVVPTGGSTISDRFIPEGTSVYMSQFAACRNARNFLDADQFVPERWLGDPKYKNDRFDVAKPFSYGPRNCLGMLLAQNEMRLAVAKMVFSFDMELAESTPNWFNQKQYVLWEKNPLKVKLTKAKSSI